MRFHRNPSQISIYYLVIFILYIYIYIYIYIFIIGQARGQDGWILANFSFCVFMDQNEVELHKNVKGESGQYPAILTELTKGYNLLHGIKSTAKNDHRTCLSSSTGKKASCM